MLRAKWHCRCSETKNKFPKHYEYFFSLFFTSCLNSTVSLPSSSFVLTKDILTQVRKPPENFQLEYELSQSFMNFAFSGLKGKEKKKHYFIDQTGHCKKDNVRLTGTSNYVHNSFYPPPAKFNIFKTLCSDVFINGSIHWCILNCRGDLPGAYDPGIVSACSASQGV